jgi:hypothetical protein
MRLRLDYVAVCPRQPTKGHAAGGSGRSAVWLAHLTGGQGVGGSNPLAPTNKRWTPRRHAGGRIRGLLPRRAVKKGGLSVFNGVQRCSRRRRGFCEKRLPERGQRPCQVKMGLPATGRPRVPRLDEFRTSFTRSDSRRRAFEYRTCARRASSRSGESRRASHPARQSQQSDTRNREEHDRRHPEANYRAEVPKAPDHSRPHRNAAHRQRIIE